ncbi:hypothetical protein E3N88_30419 [Mikania micrantha]|uniref:Uncharacterized protein n=1 Tax=Mikania micrantha TaxID=192012 RepID=A0A5N6MLK0_9ASTR|nr:hypothetical protein E3N88_30419 [Mikania micrantha]
MAVQRQTAASRSARPWMRLQHGLVGGEPSWTETKPSKSAHTPSFKVSLGQVPLVGFGFGFGVGLPQVPQPLTMAKKSRLSARKRTSEALLFESMSKFAGINWYTSTCKWPSESEIAISPVYGRLNSKMKNTDDDNDDENKNIWGTTASSTPKDLQPIPERGVKTPGTTLIESESEFAKRCFLSPKLIYTLVVTGLAPQQNLSSIKLAVKLNQRYEASERIIKILEILSYEKLS